ncbi:hypothetical protein DXG03_002147 [Asterophora parasitica]|uniref:Uncharacterized protein n=1 Tax=Asterophora parasitica TaxID=117018 RepID=A0A9P7G5Z8_9AGAR|nr:hypothetical protein DXG03_002147 [Asterophora parasitica]
MLLSQVEMNCVCNALELYKHQLRPENMKTRMNLNSPDPQKDLEDQRAQQTLEVRTYAGHRSKNSSEKVGGLSSCPVEMMLEPWLTLQSSGWLVIHYGETTPFEDQGGRWTPKGMLALHNGLSRHYNMPGVNYRVYDEVVRKAGRGDAAAPPAHGSSSAAPPGKSGD